MFTGIVTAIGKVAALDRHAGGARLAIACPYDPATIDIGASISCAGACLTVVACVARDGGAVFEADVSGETLSLTMLGDLAAGSPINLERPLRVGDELGGHIVQGHVDGVARITARTADGDSVRFGFAAPADLARFIAPKGSVTLDGTSLTVNEVDGATFGVNIVPHTSAVTTWGIRRPGDRVNLEVDVLARYVARLGRAEGEGP